LTWGQDVRGGHLAFSRGAYDPIAIANPPDVPLTVAYWVMETNQSAGNIHFGICTSGSNWICLGSWPGSTVISGTYNIGLESSAALLNVWSRIVMVQTASDLKIYVNGVDKTYVGSGDNWLSRTTSYIGGREPGGYMLYGRMADFQIWNQAWSAADVLADYANPYGIAGNPRFLVEPRKVYFVASGGGGTAYSETLSLAVASAISNAGNLAMFPSLFLICDAAQSDGGNGTFPRTVTLTANADQTQSGILSLISTLALASQAGMTPASIAELIGHISLTSSAGVASSSLGNLLGQAGFSAGASITSSSIASLVASLGLSADTSIALSNNASINALLSLAASVGQTQYDEVVGQLVEILSMAVSAGIDSSANQSMANALTFSASSSITPSAQLLATISLALSAQAAITAIDELNGREYTETLSLAVSAAISNAVQQYITTTTFLEAGATITPYSQGNLRNSIVLGVQANLLGVANDAMEALISLGVSVQEAYSASLVMLGSLTLQASAAFSASSGIGGILGEILKSVSVSLNATYRIVGMTEYRTAGLIEYKARRI
jgi:hypothetical protein